MAKKYNICLDIGGTKILGVIFDQDKNIVYRIKKKTKKDGDSTDNVEKVIISVVEEMLEGSGISKKEVAAIAAGAPGVIDQAKGIILFSPNLPWRNYDIKSSNPGSARKKSPRSQLAHLASSIRPRESSCSPPTFLGETMTSSPPWRRSSAFRSISETM